MILPVLLLLLGGFPITSHAAEPLFLNQATKQDQGLVVKVVDSDKLVLENGQRIQLIGVQSIGLPARKRIEHDEDGEIIEVDDEVLITIEEQALTYAQEMVEDKKVRLEYDIEHRSLEGYLYAYVFLSDGRMVNQELLKMGFVNLSLAPPNLKYADQLRDAYKEARDQKRGIAGD